MSWVFIILLCMILSNKSCKSYTFSQALSSLQFPALGHSTDLTSTTMLRKWIRKSVKHTCLQEEVEKWRNGRIEWMKRKRSWIKVIYIVQSGSLSRKYIPHSGRSSENPQPNCSICPHTENQTSYCQKPVCVEEEIWSHTKIWDLHLDTQEAVMSTTLLEFKVVPFKNRACGNTRENWNTTAP